MIITNDDGTKYKTVGFRKLVQGDYYYSERTNKIMVWEVSYDSLADYLVCEKISDDSFYPSTQELNKKLQDERDMYESVIKKNEEVILEQKKNIERLNKLVDRLIKDE